MRVTVSLILTVALLLPTTASRAAPFEGSWAADKDHCAKPNESNIRIIGGSYFGHETECAIRNTNRRPLGYTLALDCRGKGSDQVSRTKVAVRSVAGGARLLVNGTTLVRCQGGLQPPNYPTLDHVSP